MIDVLNLPSGDIFDVCPPFKEITCFVDFSENKEKRGILPLRETLLYVYMLYTKDSFLNKKPPDDLSIRKIKAAKLAGLEPDHQIVQNDIFGLNNEAIQDLVCSYLISQGSASWSNRCAIEAQMEENIRIRFKPIESDKGDKDTIDASTKKYLLTEHFAKYQEQNRRLDREIFIDHEDVKDIAVRKRTTLESLIK